MITIDWGNTYVIDIPQSFLTLLSGTIYELDTDIFRKELKTLEASEIGIVFPDTHTHFTEITIAGIAYARAISIIVPYSVEFEDGQYTVILRGSNNNIWDVQGGILQQNQVQLVPTNSAGLINNQTGVSNAAAELIAGKVWDLLTADHTNAGSFGKAIEIINQGVKDGSIFIPHQTDI